MRSERSVVLYDASGNPLAVQDGVAIPANTPGLLAAGSDGANARYVRVDASGRQVVLGHLSHNAGAPAATNIGVLPAIANATIPTYTNGNQILLSADLNGAIRVVLSASADALPKMVNLFYDKSDGAIVANAFKRVITYTVPVGFNGYIIRCSSFQAEAASSRVVAQKTMGAHDFSTNTFTPGGSYVSPQWTAIVEANVTTTVQSGSGDVVLTVTYTNETGASGRTGTITVPRGSAVGSRWSMTLQSGDIGVRSIQAVSSTPIVTGVVDIYGLVQLVLHQDQSNTLQSETVYGAGAVAFPTGTILGVEYKGGTVSKQRTLGTLIQLVQI